MIKLVVVFIFLLAVGCQDPEPEKYIISFNTEVVDPPSKSDVTKWKATITEAIDSISGYFGIEYTDTLQVFLVNDGSIEGGLGHIYMTPYSITGKEDILHEITHAIVPLKISCFYNEGLAVFMSEYFADKPFRFKSADKWVMEHRDSLISIENLAKDNTCYQIYGELAKNLGYVEAGSFHKFLNAKYGRDALRVLVATGGAVDYVKAFGKDLADLEKEWLEKLFPTDTLSLNSHFLGNGE